MLIYSNIIVSFYQLYQLYLYIILSTFNNFLQAALLTPTHNYRFDETLLQYCRIMPDIKFFNWNNCHSDFHRMKDVGARGGGRANLFCILINNARKLFEENENGIFFYSVWVYPLNICGRYMKSCYQAILASEDSIRVFFNLRTTGPMPTCVYWSSCWK